MTSEKEVWWKQGSVCLWVCVCPSIFTPRARMAGQLVPGWYCLHTGPPEGPWWQSWVDQCHARLAMCHQFFSILSTLESGGFRNESTQMRQFCIDKECVLNFKAGFMSISVWRGQATAGGADYAGGEAPGMISTVQPAFDCSVVYETALFCNCPMPYWLFFGKHFVLLFGSQVFFCIKCLKAFHISFPSHVLS